MGSRFSVKDIDALAALPSKEEIYAKLLMLMNAPGTQLAQVINAVGRNVAVVLGQGVERASSRKHSFGRPLTSAAEAVQREGVSAALKRCSTQKLLIPKGFVMAEAAREI